MLHPQWGACFESTNLSPPSLKPAVATLWSRPDLFFPIHSQLQLCHTRKYLAHDDVPWTSTSSTAVILSTACYLQRCSLRDNKLAGPLSDNTPVTVTHLDIASNAGIK